MSVTSAPVIQRIPDFWDRVRSAAHRVLALDYDGTLAPFQIDRRSAVPHEGVVDSLKRIQADRQTTVAIISGRPVTELVELLGDDLAIPLFGTHGYEYRSTDRVVYCSEISAEHELGLEECWIQAHQSGYSGVLERKCAAVAAHFRGADRAAQLFPLIRKLWEPIAAAHGLIVDEFDGGLEVKAVSNHKGTAIARLMADSPPGSLCIYIGDDKTDEDAFIHLKGRGLGIKVGGSPENTAADGWVEDSYSVRAILEAWSVSGQAKG